MSKAKLILNHIIKEKAQGNTFQELNIQMKIMMKGVLVKAILEEQISDEPELIEKLKSIATDFNVDVSHLV